MLRLRTTTTLSVLACVISVVATQWLSDQTGSSAEPVAVRRVHRAVMHQVVAPHAPHRAHFVSNATVMAARARYAPMPVASAIASDVSHPAAVAWVPVSMPVSSVPFTQMRDHGVGHLVLHLVIDGQGQVAQATLAESSGDAVLDANALAMARHWRFAVPVDHPQGFSGDLPLSFGSGAAQFAQMP
jgi:periplasmic protein TonB